VTYHFDPILGQGRDGAVSLAEQQAGFNRATAAEKAAFQSSVSGASATQTDYDRYFRISAWGDSFTDIGAPWFQNALPKFGMHYGGYTGETSTQIKVRMLARPDRHNDISIIWVGRNNFSSPSTVKADIAEMVAALASPKRFLIVSVFNGTTEPAPGANYNTIITLNNELAALYGPNYLDARALLVAAYNPALPQDVIDRNNDVPPLSLRADTLHYNTAGAKIVAAAIAAWVATVALPSEAKWVEYRDIDALLGNSPAYKKLNVAGDGEIRVGGKPAIGSRVDYGSWYLAGAYNYTATGQKNIVLGDGAMLKASGASGCVAIGYNALTKNTIGDGNVAVGDSAMASITTGYQNMAIGSSSMLVATTSQQNVSIGYAALGSATTGNGNVAIGASALLGVTTADGCVAIGNVAMRNATQAFQSVAVGYGSLYRYAGAYGVAIGGSALGNTVAAFGQVAVGYEALSGLNVGANTVAVGYRSGKSSTSANSVFLGPFAGDKETGASKLLIDNASRASESTARDLGLIYGEFAATAEAQRLKLNAAVRGLTTTVAALPAASIGAGYRAFVTDAQSPSFGAAVAGGGATASPVYSDGAMWRVG
jgi:lysophospholipase L1-like esterase